MRNTDVICAWIKSWVNNRDAGDLKRHRAHYDVTVIWLLQFPSYLKPHVLHINSVLFTFDIYAGTIALFQMLHWQVTRYVNGLLIGAKLTAMVTGAPIAWRCLWKFAWFHFNGSRFPCKCFNHMLAWIWKYVLVIFRTIQSGKW